MRVPLGSALVLGFGVTGRAVAKALTLHGVTVIAVDEHPTDAIRAEAASMGVEIVESPSSQDLTRLVSGCDLVIPSPGIPETHPIFELAAACGKEVESEFDLADRWDSRPIVAITGTDGKTTVTTLVTAMLLASGIRAVACGNTDTPLVEAIADPDVEVFVVEASSFRLATTRWFQPSVAVWLNFAPDHLDAHASLASYEAAKASIWMHLDPETGVAVASATDPVVLANRNPELSTVTFGGPGTNADATVVDGWLRLPDGTAILAIEDLPRGFPHDITNALAASVAAMAAGATIEGLRQALRSFRGLHHRVELVGECNGTLWFDDSKATTPHAVATALSAFDSVVLIAGGRNKGLDLSVLANCVPPVRAVVAIGEAAEEVQACFNDRCEVHVVHSSIEDAVSLAATLATAGDVVLLSPGCASFDWFTSYSERGDRFADAVRRLPNFVSVGAP
ncbi:MAG: UDP-N-acetylmuramoyl-L-alanine--D-glutamate ligase [Actinobacteria bacterium]|nr:UDP-N-acetylmuramoyl-L-alanine--D-glutamate ligase [Actinomycetota bacterium]MSZ51941.1 UDP-N-acetylmuramoyl-L-alanine--D-glutamate ligase [Actinomycetota bacterium]MTA41885.1 UDP-N-acetylmuramoyl-L-alanine--D-glutamate ligase [Actinomycetota bacterium]MTA44023.1 UDP-N-acetylmuramoyl-L-alanine--D-glutamate ligase [Actinomycetota bacterium]MTB22709.1 UDP-N-acetylmuramoyl-L-alanine--D-glutamate ligase [Actinomycetota bacterium]